MASADSCAARQDIAARRRDRLAVRQHCPATDRAVAYRRRQSGGTYRSVHRANRWPDPVLLTVNLYEFAASPAEDATVTLADGQIGHRNNQSPVSVALLLAK